MSTKNIVADLFKKFWTVLVEAFSSFRKNNDLTAASSLAFSATLALIPALFLLTSLLGIAVGSSQEALRRVQEMVVQLIPSYSESILKEVRYIATHKRTFGMVNFLILMLSITPLVSDMRFIIGAVFKKRPARPFLLEKLFDVAITVIFLIGIAAIAVAGVVITFAQRLLPVRSLPAYLEGIVPFFFIAAVVFLLYLSFSRKARLLHLVAGALLSAGLWFVMRPLFHAFLAYNPGYGFAFGSFKSLFVVIIWIYYSLAVFLFGAEMAASLGRKETVFIKKLMEGKRNVPGSIIEKYVLRYGKGDVIFEEGDEGKEMFSVLKGNVGIQKDGREIAVIPEGRSFGEMSFLLSAPRSATAVALDEVELITISNHTINSLMNEFPEFILEMLREMASRLRETGRRID